MKLKRFLALALAASMVLATPCVAEEIAAVQISDPVEVISDSASDEIEVVNEFAADSTAVVNEEGASVAATEAGDAAIQSASDGDDYFTSDPSEADYAKYGYRPLPFETEPAQSIFENIPEGLEAVYTEELESLEAKYVTDKKYLPSLRNQNPTGTCWAHAALGSAEISIAKKGGDRNKNNFSEAELAYFSYNSKVDPLGGTEGDSNKGVYDSLSPNCYQLGGNLFFTKNVLANWVGAADEVSHDTAIDNSGSTNYDLNDDNPGKKIKDEYAYDDAAHLVGSYYADIASNPDEVKMLIKEYGGVCASYYHANAGYNSDYNSYFCPVSNDGNHAIMIVGWDDNFSKDNFTSYRQEGNTYYPDSNGTIKPDKDGAWLIRNSWTTTDYVESMTGYFWMSYCDKSLLQDRDIYCLEFDTVENSYDNNYQYDGSQYSLSKALSNGSKAANIFTAKANGSKDETLKAVGLWSETANQNVTVDIYKGLTDGTNPESGTKAATLSNQVLRYPGYHTLTLNDTVTLKSGEKFSVVITFNNTGSNNTIEYETSCSGFIKCVASSKTGQSFIKTGSSWTDFGTNGNLRIKAFTNGKVKYSTEVESIEFSSGTYNLSVGEEKELNYTVKYKELEEPAENSDANSVKLGNDVYAAVNAGDSDNAGYVVYDPDGTITGDMYGYKALPFETEPAESILKNIPEGMEAEYAEEIESLEEKYVTDKAYLPSLRDQNPTGTCWAHAALGSAEISLAKKGGDRNKNNFSEAELAYFSYNSKVDPLRGTIGDSNNGVYDSYSPNCYQLGGNLYFARNVLANWVGAGDEVGHGTSIDNSGKEKYDTNDDNPGNKIKDSYAYDDAAHLVGSYYADIASNPDEVKMLIKEYGGVCASYNHQNAAYNSKYNSYYMPYSNPGNHAIMLVGWDDNFKKENFNFYTSSGKIDANGSLKPSKDGAWLIRNSWTTKDYEESMVGYFWISYCDSSLIGDQDIYCFDFDLAADSYDNNYQYDGSQGSTTCYLDKGNKAANIFTAKANGEDTETLKAVAFWTQTANQQVDVNIYTGLSDANNPESGTKAATLTNQVTKFPGYHTLTFDKDVILKPGETFSVVITFNNSSSNSIEQEISGSGFINCVASSKAGQSFIYNGSSWSDFGQAGSGNLRIKAFTNGKTAPGQNIEGIEFGSSEYTIEVGEVKDLDYTIKKKDSTKSYGVNSEITYTAAGEIPSTDEMAGGYRPDPVELQPVDSIFDNLPEGYEVESLEDLEESYVTDAAYLPPVRNQAYTGTCWAHSSLGLAEISLAKKGKFNIASDNLSELELAYFSYNSEVDPLGGTTGDINRGSYNASSPNCYQLGGNLIYSERVLAGWMGAASEAAHGTAISESEQYNTSDDNPNNVINPTAMAYDDFGHMIGSYHVDIKDNRDEAKNLIKKYGGLGIAYLASDDYYNETNNTFYCPVESGTNHAVMVVGWDDNFSKDKFTGSTGSGTLPAGDGAWLVRNSWNWYGNQPQNSKYTYFWMSYYDKSLANMAFSFEFEPSSNYDNNYQYDGCESTISNSYSASSKVANVFTAKANNGGKEYLKAVSLLTNQSNLNVNIDIYKNLTNANNPESGTHVYTSTGNLLQYSGYHTIKLNKTIELSQGDTFSVVISSPNSFNISKEASTPSGNWCEFTASIDQGQSFVYSYSSWSDIYSGSSYDYGNLCIKAFTTNDGSADPDPEDPDPEIPADITEIRFDLAGSTIPVGHAISLAYHTVPENADASQLEWLTSDSEIINIVGSDIIALKPGNATVTLRSKKNPSIKAECPIEVVESSSPFIWASSNDNVVSVKDGVITANATGSAVITVAWGKNLAVNASCNVFVIDGVIVFESSNPNVATVKDGTVTGLNKGTTKITAYLDTNPAIKAECTVNVVTKKVNKYVIKYNPGSGSGTMDDTETECGTPAKLKPNTFYKDGYKFDSWNTKSDGLGTSFKDGEKADFEAYAVNGVVTLYAQWVKKGEPYYDITGLLEKYDYTGDPIVPVFNVIYFDGMSTHTLRPGIDYSYSIRDNKKADSTALITVSGKGNFAGKYINKTFRIGSDPVDMSPDKISLKKYYKVEGINKSGYKWTGEEVEPTSFTVSAKKYDVPGSFMLKKDVDYKVYYSKNINAGKATMLICGIGDYGDCIKTSFKINKIDMKLTPSSFTVELGDTPALTNRKGAVPEMTITYKTYISGNSVEYTLVEGKDYSLKCSNNKDASSIAVGTFTIAGKGNFGGSLSSAVGGFSGPTRFKIDKASIEEFVGCVSDIPENGKVLSAKAEMYDAYGNKLPTKVFASESSIPSTYKGVGIIYMADGDELNPANQDAKNLSIADCGTAEIRLVGSGNYTGSVDISIDTYENANDRIDKVIIDKTKKFYYSGDPVTLTADDIKVYTKGNKYVPIDSSEYEICYANNINKGNALAFVKGIGSNTGYKVVKFKILPLPIEQLSWK